MNTKKHTNHLIGENNPYLLQHAHNPVDWYPWGEEAFAEATKQDKPIFLSIGYSTCHWCHVMEHESFEDAEAAKLMNDAFVCIKVDREERPDIDSIYMTACQMMTGGGGWPLTIIMTPNKKPFFAATYIPRESRFGRIGLLELIPKLDEVWKTKRAELLQSANHITNTINTMSAQADEKINPDIWQLAVTQMINIYDPIDGGFGDAPKFPSAHKLILLLQAYYYSKNENLLSIAETTLKKMRLGGIYDQLGYGFHRYSTDKEWLLPHFEKMLYDQAMLSSAYLDAFLLTENRFYAETAEEIFTYLIRDMRSPVKGFYSAEDADSDGEEGKYYVWTNSELKGSLNDNEYKIFTKLFNISEGGNYLDEASRQASGKNIPHLNKLLTDDQREMVEPIRKKLLTIRNKRVLPPKDTKILMDWNALIIASFAKGARILKSEQYETVAIDAMDFLLENMLTKDNKLMHRYRNGDLAVNGKLDDYSFMVHALLELYETTFNLKYLERAVSLADFTIKHFKDSKNGGFFISADYDEKLIARSKDAYDGAMPSGNSILALNLVKLSRLTGNSAYEDEADQLINSFAKDINRSPDSFAQMLIAYHLAKNKSREIVVVGNPDFGDTEKIIQHINTTFLPDALFILKTKDNAKALAKVANFTQDYSIEPNQVSVFICSEKSCQAPLSNLKEIVEAIK